MSLVKYVETSTANFNALSTKQPNTMYVVKDDVATSQTGKLYKGNVLIGNGNAADRLIVQYMPRTNVNAKDLLAYNEKVQGYLPICINVSGDTTAGNGLATDINLKMPILIAESTASANTQSTGFVQGVWESPVSAYLPNEFQGFVIGENVYLRCSIASSNETYLSIYYDGATCPLLGEHLLQTDMGSQSGLMYYRLGIAYSEESFYLMTDRFIIANTQWSGIQTSTRQTKFNDVIYSYNHGSSSQGLSWTSNTSDSWKRVCSTNVQAGLYDISFSMQMKLWAYMPQLIDSTGDTTVIANYQAIITADDCDGSLPMGQNSNWRYYIPGMSNMNGETIIYKGSYSHQFFADSDSAGLIDYWGPIHSFDVATGEFVSNVVYEGNPNASVKLSLWVRPTGIINLYGNDMPYRFMLESGETATLFRATYLDNYNDTYDRSGPKTGEYTMYSITTTVMTNGSTGSIGGSCIAKPTMAMAGERVYVQAYPEQNATGGVYELTGLTYNGVSLNVEATGGSYSFIMPSTDVEIIANYTFVEYENTVTINGFTGFTQGGLSGTSISTITHVNNCYGISSVNTLPVSISTIGTTVYVGLVSNSANATAYDLPASSSSPNKPIKSLKIYRNGILKATITQECFIHCVGSYRYTLYNKKNAGYVIDLNDYEYDSNEPNIFVINLDLDPAQSQTTYTVTCNYAIGGTTVATPSSGIQGTVVNVTMTPAANYSIESCTLNGASWTVNPISNNGIGSFTIGTSNVTIISTYAEQQSIRYTATVGNISDGASHNGSMSLSASGYGTSSSSINVPAGTLVTVNYTAPTRVNNTYPIFNKLNYQANMGSQGSIDIPVESTDNINYTGSFTMPASSVTVNAVFNSATTVNIRVSTQDDATAENYCQIYKTLNSAGGIYADFNSCLPGDVIMFYVSSNSNMQISGYRTYSGITNSTTDYRGSLSSYSGTIQMSYAEYSNYRIYSMIVPSTSMTIIFDWRTITQQYSLTKQASNSHISSMYAYSNSSLTSQIAWGTAVTYNTPIWVKINPAGTYVVDGIKLVNTSTGSSTNMQVTQQGSYYVAAFNMPNHNTRVDTLEHMPSSTTYTITCQQGDNYTIYTSSSENGPYTTTTKSFTAGTTVWIKVVCSFGYITQDLYMSWAGDGTGIEYIPAQESISSAVMPASNCTVFARAGHSQTGGDR